MFLNVPSNASEGEKEHDTKKNTTPLISFAFARLRKLQACEKHLWIGPKWPPTHQATSSHQTYIKNSQEYQQPQSAPTSSLLTSPASDRRNDTVVIVAWAAAATPRSAGSLRPQQSCSEKAWSQQLWPPTAPEPHWHRWSAQSLG